MMDPYLGETLFADAESRRVVVSVVAQLVRELTQERRNVQALLATVAELQEALRTTAMETRTHE